MSQQVYSMAAHQVITVLKVESTTWNRDSHELFDYESRHVFDRKFLLRKHARVFRNTQQVEIVSDGQQLPSNADYLLSVKARDGRFYVYPADRNVGGQNLQPRKLWLIIKHLPMEHYPLNEGDVIKLGRFKLRVKQIVTETNGTNSPIDFKLDDVEVPTSDLTPEESQNMQCRICLLEGGVDDDPLVRACQCKGSIMYVHLDCLRHWVNGRLNLTEDPARSCCFIRQLQCELCKSPYPSTVTTRGVRLPIVKVPNVQPPFIVLENMVGPTNRGVHLCSMAVKKECKLGRGHESDVRIADVSISRFHAMIRYQDGSFYLQDHTSKFGTLVALRKPTVVERAEKLSVQVGRTVLHFTLEDIPSGSIINDVTELADTPQQQQPSQSQSLSQQPSGIQESRQPDTHATAGHVQSPAQGGMSAHTPGFATDGAPTSSLLGNTYAAFAHQFAPLVGPVPGGPRAAEGASPPQNLGSSSSNAVSGTAPVDASRNANLAFRANPISYSRPTVPAESFSISEGLPMGYVPLMPRPQLSHANFPPGLLPSDGGDGQMRYNATDVAMAPGSGHYRNPGIPDWGLLIANNHVMLSSDALGPLILNTENDAAGLEDPIDGREADVPSRSHPIIAPEIEVPAPVRSMPEIGATQRSQDGRSQRVFSPSKRAMQRLRNSSTPPDQNEQCRITTPDKLATMGFPGSAQSITDPRFVNALASKLQAMQGRFPQRSQPPAPSSSGRPSAKSPTDAQANKSDSLPAQAPQSQAEQSWNTMVKDEAAESAHRRPPSLIQSSSPFCPPPMDSRTVSPFQGFSHQSDLESVWRLTPAAAQAFDSWTPSNNANMPQRWQPVSVETPTHHPGLRNGGRPEQTSSPRQVGTSNTVQQAAGSSTPHSGSAGESGGGNCMPNSPAPVGL